MAQTDSIFFSREVEVPVHGETQYVTLMFEQTFAIPHPATNQLAWAHAIELFGISPAINTLFSAPDYEDISSGLGAPIPIALNADNSAVVLVEGPLPEKGVLVFEEDVTRVAPIKARLWGLTQEEAEIKIENALRGLAPVTLEEKARDPSLGGGGRRANSWIDFVRVVKADYGIPRWKDALVFSSSMYNRKR